MPQEQTHQASVAKALSAIAKREREARAAREAAEGLAGKWQPLEEAASKGDIQGLIRVAGQIAGLSPESVMDAIVSSIAEEGREKTPQELVAAQVAEALAAEKKRAEETAAEENKRRLSTAREGFVKRVADEAAQGDAYPLIAHFGAAPEVLTLVEQWHAESGEFLGTAQAMQLVEAKYREMIEQASGRLKPASAVAPQSAGAAVPSLSNRTTGGAPGVALSDDIASLPEGARIRLAMARANVRSP